MYIDFIVPELYESDGGIQNYSKTLIYSVRALLPNAILRVFVLNDGHNHDSAIGQAGITYFNAARSKPRFVSSLFKAARLNLPSLVISTHPNFAPLQSLHKSIFHSKYWCAAHGIDAWNIGRGLQRISLSRLDRLLPVSGFTRDRLSAQLCHNCPEQTVLPNSFDHHRFSPGIKSDTLLRNYGIDSGAPVIVTLSRLSFADRYKNIDRLIESIPFLLPSFPGIKLIIVGDGDDKERLANLVNHLNIQQSVVFAGRIRPQHIAEHLRLASVFVLPSSAEGFGIVFLEALGCGIPVIAGNQDGSSEPLCGGLFGQLVDPDLPLAPVISSMLSRKGPALWFNPHDLSTAVSNEFNTEAFRHKLYAILHQDGFV